MWVLKEATFDNLIRGIPLRISVLPHTAQFMVCQDPGAGIHVDLIEWVCIKHLKRL